LISLRTVALEGSLRILTQMRAAAVVHLTLVNVHTVAIDANQHSQSTVDGFTSRIRVLSAWATTHESGLTAVLVLLKKVAQGTAAFVAARMVDALVRATARKKTGTLVHILAAVPVVGQLIALIAGAAVRA